MDLKEQQNLPYTYTVENATRSLIISSIQRPEDVEGVAFRCVASNRVGSDVSEDFTVTIRNNS